MSNQINIVQQDGTQVDVTSTEFQVVVTTSDSSTVVTVTEKGPKGNKGDKGEDGANGSFPTSGSYAFTGTFVITGSLIVSSSNTFINQGPAQFTGSVEINGDLLVNGSNITSISASFAQDILSNSNSISILSSSFNSVSSSNSIRLDSLEQFSSSLNNTFATDFELNEATASLSASIAYLSASYINDSSSFDFRILNNSSSISLLSGSYLTDSGSFSIRVTNLEQFSASLNDTFATDFELNSATNSLSSSIAYLSASYLEASASFDYRINSISVESLGPGVIPVDVATTAALRSSTYYNGLGDDGIGATLTSTANGALGSIDSTTTLLNWRILVKNQTSQLQNGVYELTQTGSSIAPFILTRTTDSDETVEFSPQIAIPTAGTINKNVNFSQITEDPVVGVDNIVYQQLSGSNNYLSQQTVGTQAINQIPIYTGVAKELTRGSSTFTYTVSSGQFRIRNIPYIYPSAQGSNGTVLINNGLGTLRWSNNFTGSFSGSHIGNTIGTASWASNSLTASYINLAQTASYVLNSISSSTALTASYVNPLNQDVLITGGLTVLNGVTVYGSSSFTYITASQLAVSASTISVNVFEPVQRFGGLVIYDSGSSQATASFLWDSLHNHFIYQNVSGSTYSGAMFLSGPKNTGALGDEPTLTRNFIPRSDGDDHLYDTQIYSSGSITQITGSLIVTAGITGSLFGTSSAANSASWAAYALTASYLDSYIPPFPYTGSAEISGSLNITNGITGSLFGTSSYANQSLSSSFALTASYALNAGGGGSGAGFPYSGSAVITGSLTVTAIYSPATNLFNYYNFI